MAMATFPDPGIPSASRILPSQKPKPDDIRSVVNGPELSESSAGLLADEDGDIALIRDQWLQSQFNSLRGEYSQTSDIRLRIGTFNVNDKPPTQDLTSWILGTSSGPSSGSARTSLDTKTSNQSKNVAAEEEVLSEPVKNLSAEAPTSAEDASSLTESTVVSSITLTPSNDTPLDHTPSSSVSSRNCEDLPDVFVLGFQELDLSSEALLYSTSTLKADAWIVAVFDALGKNANDYIHLVHRQLVGVLVIVIIRKELQSIVEEVSTASAGVGIMGIMGNKGATAVRLRLNSTIVTFVCSHLAAFDEYVEKRNNDFTEICRKLQFPITWKGTRGVPSITASIWETDVLFWLGGMPFPLKEVYIHLMSILLDLNYRIDLPDQEVRAFLASKPQCCENDTLLAYDQLKTTARQQRAFTDFIENSITFLPTYRFSDPPLDGLGYDLKRRPAWTDRILYLATDPQRVSQMSYESHPQITLSDHRPVSAEFKLRLYRNDAHELHRVAMSLFGRLGDFEDSASTPNITLLDGTEIDLGHVSYPRVVSRTITVKNQGDIACAFRFIPLEPGSSISKEWLKVEPICGILLPQESEAIRLTTNLDKRTASFLNHGNMKLEDSLILHLVKGTDFLITVSGSYQPTCFANSLAWLVRSPGPIRGEGDAPLLPPANTLSAPRELMFLIEWLITNAHDMNDLFVTRGDESLVDMIRVHLDTRHLNSEETISFPEDTDKRSIAMAFADTMLQFLESLTEPMIPWVLHPRCALARDREDVFEILDHVPGFARNVYVTITAFLHFIGRNGPDRPTELAKIFANVLLPDDPRAPSGIPPLTPLGKRNFLLYTIS